MAAGSTRKFPIAYIANENLDKFTIVKDFSLIDQEIKKGRRLRFTAEDLYVALQYQDLSSACLYAQDSFPSIFESQNSKLVEVFIRTLHKRAAQHLVLLSDASQSAGAYTEKATAIIDSKGRRIPMTPVDKIPEAMVEFCTRLTKKFQELKENKIKIEEVAVFALFELGRIHPFLNGNGRVARLLMNSILINFGFDPVIFTDKDKYYKAFEAAYSGNMRVLNKLITSSLKDYAGGKPVDKRMDIAMIDEDRSIILNNPKGIVFAHKSLGVSATITPEKFETEIIPSAQLPVQNFLCGMLKNKFSKTPSSSTAILTTAEAAAGAGAPSAEATFEK